MEKIVIGTRGSALALIQAEQVKATLEKIYNNRGFNLKIIKTKGDKIQNVALAKIGGKGLFTKEIEDALFKKEISLAVHSMKDLPVDLPEGLILAAIMKRIEPRDVLISREKVFLKNIKDGAKIGTSSPRRAAQLRAVKKDFKIFDLRGNITTRLKKIFSENFDAIVIAAAGLLRIGWIKEGKGFLKSPDELLYGNILPLDIMLPAVGQGAIGVEVCSDNLKIINMLSKINDKNTHIAISAERSFLKALGGGCQTPIGAFATINKEKLTIIGGVFSDDGQKISRAKIEGKKDKAEELGRQLAEKVEYNVS